MLYTFIAKNNQELQRITNMLQVRDIAYVLIDQNIIVDNDMNILGKAQISINVSDEEWFELLDHIRLIKKLDKLYTAKNLTSTYDGVSFTIQEV